MARRYYRLVNRHPNIEMEPTLLPVRAIMSLKRAAHFGHWADVGADPDILEKRR
jgi:hypothetical protein